MLRIINLLNEKYLEYVSVYMILYAVLIGMIIVYFILMIVTQSNSF